MHLYTVAAQVGPEDLAVVVDGGRVFLDDLPCSQHGAEVRSAGVVAGQVVVYLAVEVAVGAAGADHGFVVEAVREVSAGQETGADVALVAVASGAIVEVARVVAVTVF